MKIVWFLDIDGVLNAFPNPPTNGEFEWKFKHIAGYPIWYAPAVIDFINAAVDSGLVEVRWLTTWEHMANEEFGPEVGIKHKFEVEVSPDGIHRRNAGGVYWWKADRIHKYKLANLGDILIWTDDDIWYNFEDQSWTEITGIDALVICPHTSVGLRQQDLEKIGQLIGLDSMEESRG